MSRVASAESSVGDASGALRRLLAALTCFGFSMGVVSLVFMMYGEGVARREALFEPLVEALFELLHCLVAPGFHHGAPPTACTFPPPATFVARRCARRHAFGLSPTSLR